MVVVSLLRTCTRKNYSCDSIGTPENPLLDHMASSMVVVRDEMTRDDQLEMRRDEMKMGEMIAPLFVSCTLPTGILGLGARLSAPLLALDPSISAGSKNMLRVSYEYPTSTIMQVLDTYAFLAPQEQV